MSKHNIPIIKNASVRFQKEQRVFGQLTHSDALIDALITLYNNTSKCQYRQDTANKFIQTCK